jgi:hypothetical protein
VTRRCFDRSSDSIAIFKSVFLVISIIAVSGAVRMAERYRLFSLIPDRRSEFGVSIRDI